MPRSSPCWATHLKKGLGGKGAEEGTAGQLQGPVGAEYRDGIGCKKPGIMQGGRFLSPLFPCCHCHCCYHRLIGVAGLQFGCGGAIWGWEGQLGGVKGGSWSQWGQQGNLGFRGGNPSSTAIPFPHSLTYTVATEPVSRADMAQTCSP